MNSDIRLIDKQVLDETSGKAKLSPRLRMNYNFHELTDPIQRMLNAIEPGSYIRPHRHKHPDKREIFLLLRGKGAVIIFDDSGRVTDVHLLEAGGEKLGVEIPPGAWHTIVSLEEGTVFFEIKDGPYVEITDKDFAPWAPAPGDTNQGEYLQRLVSLAK